MRLRGRRGLLLLASLLLPVACQVRLVAGDEDDVGRVICTFVNGASVYDDEGNRLRGISDPETGGHSSVCYCLASEDYLANAEEYDQQYNEEALDACLEDAAGMGYPEHNDCHEVYASGHWIDMVQTWPFDPDLTCDLDADAGAAGCSVR